MTPVSGPHLTPDDFDAWLAGALAPAARGPPRPVPGLPRARGDRARDRRAARRAAADEPRARVRRSGHGAGRGSPARSRVPTLASLRQPGLRHPPLAWPLAASLLVLVAGSMAGSIVWTLGHQDTLAALGGWLTAQAGQAAWLGVRGVASNFIEQPWFAGLKALAAQPGPSRARLRARAHRLPGRRPGAPPPPGSADAAGGPCERLAGCFGRLALLVDRSPRLPPSPAPSAIPTGSRTVRAGPRLLVARLRRRRPARRRRRPQTPHPAPQAIPPGAEGRAPGRARRPEQAHRHRGAAPGGAPPARRRRPRHGAQRHRPAGRLQHRLQRDRAGPPARGAGHRRRLRQAAGQSRHRRGRRGAAPRRRRLGRHPHARRRGARRGRRDRRRGADLPVRLRARRPRCRSQARRRPARSRPCSGGWRAWWACSSRSARSASGW